MTYELLLAMFFSKLNPYHPLSTCVGESLFYTVIYIFYVSVEQTNLLSAICKTGSP